MTSHQLRSKIFFLDKDITLSHDFPNIIYRILSEQSQLLGECLSYIEQLEREYT